MMYLRVAFLLALDASSVGLASSALAQTDQASDGAARTFFDQGRAAYEAGRFEEASRLLRRAYLLSPRFALLYNIGQAELRAGHDAQALEAFEGFLRQAPAEDARRSEVEERARVLRALGPATTAPATTAPATTAPATTAPATTAPATTTTTTTRLPVEEPVIVTTRPQADSGGADATPWIIAGIGGAVLVTGVVLVAVGVTQGDTAANQVGPVSYPSYQSQISDANTLLGLGIGLTVVGAIGTGVGVIWAVSSPGASSASSASARLHVVPNGLLLEGAF